MALNINLLKNKTKISDEQFSKLSKEVEIGEAVQFLSNDKRFGLVLESLKNRYFNEWFHTDIDDVQQREHLFTLYQNVEDIRKELNRMEVEGRNAFKKLNKNN